MNYEAVYRTAPATPGLLNIMIINKWHCTLTAAYLKVTSLVESVGGPKERDLPQEHVLLIDQLDPEALDRVLLQGLVLEGQGPDGRAAGDGHGLV